MSDSTSLSDFFMSDSVHLGIACRGDRALVGVAVCAAGVGGGRSGLSEGAEQTLADLRAGQRHGLVSRFRHRVSELHHRHDAGAGLGDRSADCLRDPVAQN